MATINRYIVEYDDGESDECDTFAEADALARRLRGKVVEYEYEYSDSIVVADHTATSDRGEAEPAANPPAVYPDGTKLWRAPFDFADGTAGEVTITESDGPDHAVVVLVDTEFEPDGSDGTRGLRVYVNDGAVFVGVERQPPDGEPAPPPPHSRTLTVADGWEIEVTDSHSAFIRYRGTDLAALWAPDRDGEVNPVLEVAHEARVFGAAKHGDQTEWSDQMNHSIDLAALAGSVDIGIAELEVRRARPVEMWRQAVADGETTESYEAWLHPAVCEARATAVVAAKARWGDKAVR
ncbi:hypothetical protein [Desertimonas flava]|uniref:hypothetical protein n=1 Tax=Desertimonas flava TaxID=2064846 RepID=UPI000E355D36|nr:hypothetical protein [Desertimonas flava]